MAPEVDDPIRPTIRLLKAVGTADATVAQLLLGIEEEGVAAEVLDHDAVDATALAREAACGSVLHVGLGATASDVALHHRELPANQPLFASHLEDLDAESLRAFGANAARLVKGNPLIIDAARRVLERSASQ